jgi:hypothetical protein
MKIVFILLLGLLIIIPSAFGVPIADKTGLKFKFPLNHGENSFIIEGAANFDVKHLSFDDTNKQITLKIESSLEENLLEIVLPTNLVGENLTFMIMSVPNSITQASQLSDTLEVIPKTIHYSESTIFATLEFNGMGTHYLTIYEPTYQNAQQTDNSNDQASDDFTESNGGGCLIATAAYGSEMAPQVQFLRELRDNTVLQTQAGTSFMTGFNQFYYSFSPAVADYERESPMFKEAVKLTLTPLLTSLAILNYVDIDTEQEMLGYGIGVILLNIGMYFVAPAVVIISLKKRFKF